MTTTVTVKAHYWPVKVTKIGIAADNGRDLPEGEEIVPQNTTKDFYIHSSLRLKIDELPHVDEPAPVPAQEEPAAA